jgi:hypothetical protein
MFTLNQRAITVAVFTLFSLAAINANAESIAGHSKCSYKPTAANVANTDGYAVMLSETSCTFNGSGFNEGASVSNPEIANLHQGTGDHSGYYTVTSGDDSTVSKWSGHVTTIMKDGNPMTSFKGQWEYVGGAGKYKGIKGNGDYTGYFTSATEYVVDWKGRKN